MVQKYFNFTELADTHAHINVEPTDQIPQIISDANSAGVKIIFDVGIDILSSKSSIQLSKDFNKIRSFVGIDPDMFLPNSHGIINKVKLDMDLSLLRTDLVKLIEENREFVFGIGETGIDNYWLKKSKLSVEEIEKSLLQQEALFRIHLEIAESFDLPLTVHSRNAELECFEIIKDYSCFGIFHSYTGNYETAKKLLDAGWGLGVNGIITFKNSKELRDVYRRILGKIPSDAQPEWFYDRGVYFETDSPFLSPEPNRGEKNTPSNLKFLWRFIKDF